MKKSKLKKNTHRIPITHRASTNTFTPTFLFIITRSFMREGEYDRMRRLYDSFFDIRDQSRQTTTMSYQPRSQVLPTNNPTNRNTDELSTALITLGVTAVKKNPMKVGFYLVGLLLFIFFQGFKVSPIQREQFHEALKVMNTDQVNQAEDAMLDAMFHYRRLRWNFIVYESCSTDCQYYKNLYHEKRKIYEDLAREEQEKLSIAKSKLGILSEYGIDETRTLFQNSFQFGKRVATRQSQWDFFFYTINSISRSRDESILVYLIKILTTVLFNFTMGVIIAVIGFMYQLVGLVQSFHVTWYTGLFFFAFASLAAISYALTWLIGLYLLACGGVYVTVKLVAANMRLENGGARAGQNIRYHEERYYR